MLTDGATRLSPFAGEPSVATVMRATTPAVAAAGEAIARTTALEFLPESLAVIVAFPGATMSELDTEAAISVASPNCVGSGFPFQFTTAELVKPVPFSRSVKAPWPAMA